MFCTNCGASVNENENFCSKCGYPIAKIDILENNSSNNNLDNNTNDVLENNSLNNDLNNNTNDIIENNSSNNDLDNNTNDILENNSLNNNFDNNTNDILENNSLNNDLDNNTHDILENNSLNDDLEKNRLIDSMENDKPNNDNIDFEFDNNNDSWESKDNNVVQQSQNNYGMQGNMPAQPQNNYGMQGNMPVQPQNNYGMQGNMPVQPQSNYGMQGNMPMQPQYNYGMAGNMAYAYPNSGYVQKPNSAKMVLIGLGIGLGVLALVIMGLVTVGTTAKYFFSDSVYVDEEGNIQVSTSGKGGKYSTVIDVENTYDNVEISSREDAHKLISKDSVDQKGTTPDNIKAIEEEIINDYGVVAVNLCEMDEEFAKEVRDVFKVIYAEYPGVRDDLTNLSLANMDASGQYIAAFYPAVRFATSNSTTGYPWVMKTQILLNTTYFLNINRLEASVKDSSNAGHFPPNTTRYSPVAHELGHYLSFLAMLKYYQTDSILLVDTDNTYTFYEIYEDFDVGDYSYKMIKEAYDMYTSDTGKKIEFDKWRATISEYAVAKDNSGNYIYDETIAEAFHDVYLNGNNAKPASKYVIKVLKSKLN